MERKARHEPPLVIRSDNIESLLAQVPQNPMEQADRFLLNLAERSSEIPVFTYLTSNRDQGLAFIEGTDAFVGWLGFLRNEGWIEYGGERKDSPNDLCFRLTLNGWRRVQEIKSTGWRSDVIFVAMPFRADLEPVWRLLIKPAIEAAGWRPIRADKEEHSSKIDDWIMNQVRNCRAVLAETTDSNAGACFEAGFGLGHGRPVIWLAKRDAVRILHFDIRQYNHVSWEPGNEPDAVHALRERIVNTVGQGTRMLDPEPRT